MQLKYFGSKAWLAPHIDRLHSPFFGSGKLEYYLAARRPALEVRGVDAFKPVANLHRCYLRQDPVFLRSLTGQALLLRAPPAGRSEKPCRAPGACAYVLLRNSFSEKWGFFAQQRPLALSSVRRLQPPCNVTVRRQGALAYLRALPCRAHQCIYADPSYSFPGRSMNYYGTRGATTWSFTRSCKTHSSRVACPSSSASTTCRRPGSSTAGPTPSQACDRERRVASPSCL